ncbi:MAG: hypothetical protein RR554_02000 [Vagococcus sp.]|uniref:hypothetical protein n=1 Tax=Vagococcus sp. TaxID=1933889 RepID=UPI002FC6AEDD
MEKVKEKNIVSLLMGLIFFFLACWGLFNVSSVLNSMMGIIIIVCLLKASTSFFTRKTQKNLSSQSVVWLKTSSLLDVMFALLLLINLKVRLLEGAFIGFMFGIWVITDSITRLMMFKQEKNNQDKWQWLSKLSLLVGIVLGIGMLFSSWQSETGVSFMIVGYFLLLSIFKFLEGLTN